MKKRLSKKELKESIEFLTNSLERLENKTSETSVRLKNYIKTIIEREKSELKDLEERLNKYK